MWVWRARAVGCVLGLGLVLGWSVCSGLALCWVWGMCVSVCGLEVAKDFQIPMHLCHKYHSIILISIEVKVLLSKQINCFVYMCVCGCLFVFMCVPYISDPVHSDPYPVSCILRSMLYVLYTQIHALCPAYSNQCPALAAVYVPYGKAHSGDSGSIGT